MEWRASAATVAHQSSLVTSTTATLFIHGAFYLTDSY